MPYKDRAKQLAYQKTHYKEKKHLYVKNRKNSKERKKEYIRKAKDKPCQYCGMQYEHYIMEFAHRHGVDKKEKLSSMYRLSTYKEIDEEIAKCYVLDVICHRWYDNGVIGDKDIKHA